MGSLLGFSQLILLGFFILGTILISVFWKEWKIVFIGFFIIFFTSGIFLTENAETKIRNNDFTKYNLFGEDAVLTGVIMREPDARDKITKLTINKIKIAGKKSAISINGKIVVNASKYPEYNYGDLVKVAGKIEYPGVFEGFNYADYLAKDGIFATISFPKIELVKRDYQKGVLSAVYKEILGFKEKLRQSIFSNFSPPQSLILEGMILGDNGAMTQDLKNKLNITGLRHIIAVSGTHIVILSSLLMSLLLMFGLWRGQAINISLVFVILYIVLTGFAASGVRAGIMGAILLLGQKFGRMNTSSRSIIIACAVMLAINPLLLFSDVGFQLSFLSSLGIIYLFPLLDRKLKEICRQKYSGITAIVSMTLAAQIFTLPVLVFNFGNISFVSLPANILVLPIVYWLMVFGFLAGLGGMVLPFLGWVFALPCWFLLTYFLKVMDFFSQPWAVKTVQNLPWFWLAVFYIILATAVSYLNRRNRLRFLNY